MTDYTEKFEKMRAAGNVAARTLDMLTDHIKPGISTDELDNLGYDHRISANQVGTQIVKTLRFKSKLAPGS